MKQKLLILGALFAPLGLGTVGLAVVHSAKHQEYFFWAAVLMGMCCYLIVMSVLWFLWVVTFGCSKFGTCL